MEEIKVVKCCMYCRHATFHIEQEEIDSATGETEDVLAFRCERHPRDHPEARYEKTGELAEYDSGNLMQYEDPTRYVCSDFEVADQPRGLYPLVVTWRSPEYACRFCGKTYVSPYVTDKPMCEDCRLIRFMAHSKYEKEYWARFDAFLDEEVRKEIAKGGVDNE